MLEISVSKAEELAGCRLDRRRKYATTNDGNPCEISGSFLFMMAKWSGFCTGCTEFGDYGTMYGPFGCRECGYTGRRRYANWVPVETFGCHLSSPAWDRTLNVAGSFQHS